MFSSVMSGNWSGFTSCMELPHMLTFEQRPPHSEMPPPTLRASIEDSSQGSARVSHRLRPVRGQIPRSDASHERTASLREFPTPPRSYPSSPNGALALSCRESARSSLAGHGMRSRTWSRDLEEVGNHGRNRIRVAERPGVHPRQLSRDSLARALRSRDTVLTGCHARPEG